ncbi:HflK protein [Solemya velum gill symbiont]|uniref:FtsH protease activity modulator HflK n=1 Tax=Solemya velum gill symbiont TaxID=2340 RepID=UPI0009969C68|nr:FtsH protease activity modulator HflK [Solemya velum gill symbiont]OOZ15971.1 HflK protein [Solemya velum gill symbiont]OOZ20263.1 HflK protein [Solemya velum gill symbiont]OOZ23985.1 HflK protein [Solemya velum gill symbiont]OOZ25753.1 HflK protein [Solemya velum gill symbiont]OOZ30740.1 HflK protein [Solemya velum gill symbiont]
MAWNQPGGGDRDPWGGGNRNDGPPDLDEVVKNLQKKLGGLFGKSRGNGGGESSGGGGGFPSGIGGKGVAALLVVAAAVWAASGFYIVQPAERGVVLRFGAFGDVTQPGPNWHIPYPIEEVIKVNVDNVENFQVEAHMLTRDENIVDLELKVQYRISAPETYLFRDFAPEKTIRDATETTLREVVGQNPLDSIIVSENRSQIADAVEQGLRTLVERYQTGLEIVGVNIQRAGAPPAVKEAFDDVNKAREDKERFENKAEAYANEIVPRARGASARRLEDAKAYRAQVIAEAEGESARFLSLLGEYKRAPEVTRQRLYLETVEQVYSDTSKVVMDTNSSNNLTYIPLDQLMKQRTRTAPQQEQFDDLGTTAADPGDSQATERVDSRGSRDRRAR